MSEREPSEFRWGRDGFGRPVLRHGSGTWFRFIKRESTPGPLGLLGLRDFRAWPQVLARWRVGDHAPQRCVGRSWEEVLAGIRTWLDDLTADLDAPDLWAELGRVGHQQFHSDATETAENTRFTAEEQERIRRRLREAAEVV